MHAIQRVNFSIIIFITSFALLLSVGFLVANAQDSSSSAGELDSAVKRGEKLVRELSDKLAGTPDNNPGKSDANVLLTRSRNSLNEVFPELSRGNKDEALKKANLAVKLALDAINKIEGEAQAEQLAAQDENITPQDLGVGDPAILPGNPLYVVKGAVRTVQSLITFDPAAKAELKLRFANEKIIEVKKLEGLNASDDRVKNAIESYEKEALRVKIEIEKLKERGVGKTQIEALVKRTADNQIKHHKLLGKFMKDREAIAPEIEVSKAEAMKHFSESMASVVDPEVLKEKFLEAMQEQKGSSFRHFKHIEMLEEVKDFVPEQARSAIQNAVYSSPNRLGMLKSS